MRNIANDKSISFSFYHPLQRKVTDATARLYKLKYIDKEKILKNNISNPRSSVDHNL